LNVPAQVLFEECEFSRRQFLALLAQLFAIAAIPGCRNSVPSLDGMTPIIPFVAEDHSQFLSRWAAQGVRDAVLINIDTHDDIVHIPDKKISELKIVYTRKDWKTFAAADEHTSANNGLFGVGNWIYAGGMLGVFSKVYWVFPYDLIGNSSSESFMRQFLSDLHFKTEDIASFVLDNNQFRGTVNGISFTICSLESLPVITKPLLLSIDVDFFPTGSAVSQVSFLNLLHRTFKALYAKKYQLMEAAVCYSINGEYLKPYLRWLGDAVVSIFTYPGMIVNDAPSELLSTQQHLENAFRSGQADDILMISRQYLKQRTEPSLLLYQALGYMLKGDVENTYLLAMESGRLDIRYSSGLMYLGSLYYLRNEFQVAERFFQGGFSIDPNVSVGLMAYGHCLQKQGMLLESLALYQKDVHLNGSFPSQFMIVDVYIKLGELGHAERELQESIDGLEMYSAPRVLNRAAADALYAVLDYCDKKGLHTIAKKLRTHPMAPLMYKNFPRKLYSKNRMLNAK
jgi:tetratricopeptide (TPR) repeat protein